MRYEGNICPGCGEVFTQDDDVVVCPECATAQHRACYNKKGECVNAHLHSDTYQWQPEKGVSEHSSSTLSNQEKNTKTFECPACKNMCDPDKGYCEKCGAKFVVFGINIAKQLQKEQEKEQAKNQAQNGENEQNENSPEPYKPPFEIGVGEGFDNQYAEKEQDEATQEIGQQIIGALGGENRTYTEGGEEKLGFTGPFRIEDKLDGVSVNGIGTFVRNEALRYIKKFKTQDGFFSFNWAAFIFSPYWFFYRKLYKPGIIFMTLSLMLDTVVTYFSIEFTALLANSDIMLDFSAEMTEEALLEMMSGEMMKYVWYILGYWILVAVLHVVSGFVADKIYRKYVIENVREMEKMKTHNSAFAHAAKYGGVSFLFGIASYTVYNLITYMISSFFV